jgi:hypothetical protein
MERPRRSIHPARNWNFESISLQRRVVKTSVPQRWSTDVSVDHATDPGLGSRMFRLANSTDRAFIVEGAT